MNRVAKKGSEETVIGNAARALRDAIMEGHLAPGQKLVEAELVAAMDCSRPSLREALRDLAAERLVELIPNRGAFVTKLGRKEIEQIHEVWALLTGEAVFQFVGLASEKDLREIDRAVANIRKTAPAGTVLQRVQAINKFFGLILSRSDNLILAEMVGSLVCRINFLRARSFTSRSQAKRYGEEIALICKYIREKNARSARAATQAHIESVCSAALQVHQPASLDGVEFRKVLRESSKRSGADWFKSTLIGWSLK
jgi:DNA-binding GntR family transcriptional regulator